MTPGFSMMGSGIYSTTITREIVCNESCEDCDQEGKKCDAIWEEDFETDDWGNVEQEVTCKECEHTITIRRESE
jgi:hypothetical protein